MLSGLPFSANTACVCTSRQAVSEPAADDHRRLQEIVAHEAERRGLLLARGGSFGFRGHRFELIEPEPGLGQPFLRVALGWRDDHSRHGLCALFAELAAAPSFAALARRHAP